MVGRVIVRLPVIVVGILLMHMGMMNIEVLIAINLMWMMHLKVVVMVMGLYCVGVAVVIINSVMIYLTRMQVRRIVIEMLLLVVALLSFYFKWTEKWRRERFEEAVI